MPTVPVVYSSRTGHTRKVAELIAEGSAADLEQIQDVKNRRHFQDNSAILANDPD